MDIYCTTCGEPHEIECLHEPEAYGLTLQGRMIIRCDSCEGHRERGFKLRDRAEVASAMHEILGDDIDGIASMMEDYGL